MTSLHRLCSTNYEITFLFTQTSHCLHEDVCPRIVKTKKKIQHTKTMVNKRLTIHICHVQVSRHVIYRGVIRARVNVWQASVIIHNLMLGLLPNKHLFSSPWSQIYQYRSLTRQFAIFSRTCLSVSHLMSFYMSQIHNAMFLSDLQHIRHCELYGHLYYNSVLQVWFTEQSALNTLGCMPWFVDIWWNTKLHVSQYVIVFQIW